MICRTINPRSKNDYFPHFGNFVNEFINTPAIETVKNHRRNASTPAVNISENEDGFVIDLAVPGHTKEDIAISVDQDVLVIKSNKVAEINGEDYRLREFNYSGFERRFVLPDSIDQSKVDAKFINGILNITLNKKEEAKPQPSQPITIK